MSTASTEAVKQTFRDALLAFSHGGVTVASIIGSRLYLDDPPQKAPAASGFPFVVLRIANMATDEPFERTQFDVELMLFHSPRSRPVTPAKPVSVPEELTRLGDLLDGAMVEFVHNSDGLLWVMGMLRNELPATGGESDREIVQHQHRYSVAGYLHLYTQHLAA